MRSPCSALPFLWHSASAQVQKRSPNSAAGNPEADFERYLEVRSLAVLDVATGVDHFKPFQVLDALVRFSQRIVDGVLDAAGGRADQFDFLVGVMVTHGDLLGVLD
eukprot:GDKJ01033863.1.p1 GENE.GDKJ01033863.1~~GDKJ01033863.1.p1  ORF type:complete len:106 (-),score=9.96 GDKJ01033863.1:167-484(-)